MFRNIPITYKPRRLPTSGFGTHGDDTKQANKSAARSYIHDDHDEVTNWKDYV